MTAGGGHEPAAQPCLFLLFPGGQRPDADAVRGALKRSASGQVSHDPRSSGRGAAETGDWLELLCDGLTFDLLGLAPGQSLRPGTPRHRFGLADTQLGDVEAIGLAPGPHLVGAANAMPVVRTLLRTGAALAGQLDRTVAALWLPAASAMGRGLFVRAIDTWLAGGPFPGLGLVGVAQEQGGSLVSDGLDFFTGQELRLDAGLCADRPAATRLLLRIVDQLIEHGPLAAAATVALANGSTVRLAPQGGIVGVMPG